MRIRLLVSSGFLGLCALAFGGKPTVVVTARQPFSPPSYVPISHHPDVAAYYYDWYVGNQWQSLLDMAPGMGHYDSRNSAVISNHMAWAAQAGLNELILSWWGLASASGLRMDGDVPAILNAAAQNNVRVLFMIDAYAGRTPQSVASDIRYLIAQYSGYSAWYTSSRPTPYLTNPLPRPVFFVYMSATDTSTTPANWTAALDSIHANSNAAVLIHNTLDPSWVTVGHFDGMFSYGTGTDYSTRDLAQKLPAGAWYIPTAYPGFNAYRSKGWTGIVPRNGGATYDQTWSQALDLGIDMPMVSVTSFNEWTETTQIEPCGAGTDLDGFVWETYGALGAYGYLNKTLSWAQAAHAYQPADYSKASTVYWLPGTPGTHAGLWQNSWGSNGQTVQTALAGVPVVTNAAANRLILFQADKALGYSTPAPALVRVDYLDRGTGKFQLTYWGATAAEENSPAVTLTNSGTWKTAVFQLPDAVFNGSLGGKSDFRLTLATGTSLAVNLAAVIKPIGP